MGIVNLGRNPAGKLDRHRHSRATENMAAEMLVAQPTKNDDIDVFPQIGLTHSPCDPAYPRRCMGRQVARDQTTPAAAWPS